MNKLFTKIVGAALGLTMAIGLSVAVASNSEAVPVHADSASLSQSDCSGKGTSGTGGNFSVSKSVLTFDFVKSYGADGHVKMYSGSSVKISGADITAVSINCTTSGYVKTWTSFPTGISVSGSVASWSGSATSSITCNMTASAQARVTSINVTYTAGVTKHSLTYAVGTNGIHDGETTRVFQIEENTSATVKTPAEVGISANTGYKFSTWNDGTSNVAVGSSYAMGTSDHTLTAQWVVAQSYTITTTLENCTKQAGSASAIYEDGEAKLTFVPTSGYDLPSSLLPVGASVKSWDKTTGVLVLENPTANVTLTVTATLHEYNNTPNLTPGKYFIKCGSNYFTGTESNGIGGSTTTQPTTDVSKFTFTLVGDDTWNLVNDEGKYLSWTDTAKGVSLSDKAYAITVEVGSSSGTYKLHSQSNTRYFCQYDANPDFRCYNSGQSGASFDLTFEVAKDISGFSVYSTGANKNVLKGSIFDADAATAAGFEARLNYPDSTYDVVTNDATWTLDTSVVNDNATLTVSYGTYDNVEITGMNVYVVTIVSLSINTSNATTTYVEGDELSTSGLVITGYDSSDNDYSISLGDCTFSPANGATLSTSNSSVTVTYTNEDNSTAVENYPITVSAFVGYTKVTNVSQLQFGDTILIGVTETNRLMTTDAGNYRNTATSSNVSADYTRVKSTDLDSNVAKFTVVHGTTSGTYALHDGTGYLAFVSGQNYLQTTASLSSACDINLTISESVMHVTSNSVENSSEVIEIKYNSSASNRLSGYKSSTSYPTVDIYRMAGSSAQTVVDNYLTNTLKMYDDDYSGKVSPNDGENCASNYDAMVTAWGTLKANELALNLFKGHSDYAAAVARMNKWAIANSHSFNTETGVFSSVRVMPFVDIISSSSNVSIIVIISLIGMTAIGGYFFLRKRKEQ